MTADQSPNSVNVPLGEDPDDILGPASVDSGEGVRDPDLLGDKWDVCCHFLEPLADELDRWMRRPSCTEEDVEDLRWFGVGMDGIGPDYLVNAWIRAKTELDIQLSPDVRRSFEEDVRRLAQESESVLAEIEDLPTEAEYAWYRDVMIRGFAETAVSYTLRKLRDLSAVAGRKLAAASRQTYDGRTDASVSKRRADRDERPKPLAAGKIAEQQKSKEESVDPVYLFRFDGSTYRIRFDGESGTINSKLVGAKYIHELLRRPNKHLESSELQALSQYDDPELKKRRQLGHEAFMAEAEDNGFGGSGARNQYVEQLDKDDLKESLKRYHKRILEIDADMEEAKTRSDMPEQVRLAQEREDILSEVRRMTGLRGRLRRTSSLDPNEKARSSVTKRIRYVITQCHTRWYFPKLASHLETYIDLGKHCSYRPSEPAPDWHF